MLSNYEYCVRDENDINKVTQDVDKVENLHLDLRNTKLTNENFDKLITAFKKAQKKGFSKWISKTGN
jgi:hypothetical protein